MKNNFFLVLVALATLTLASCSSNLRVEKRHYNNGWYVQKGNHKQATGVATTTSPATTENAVVATTTEENATVVPVENTATETQQTAPQANPVQQKVSRTSTSSWARSAKAEETKPAIEKATAPVKTAIKHLAKSAKMDSPAAGDDKFILAIIFAILFPCIGVLIWEGSLTTHFWIALLLTFLFWIPGIIYALLVVTGSIG